MNIEVTNFTGAKWDADVSFKLIPDNDHKVWRLEWVGNDMEGITHGTVLTGVHFRYHEHEDYLSGIVTTYVPWVGSVNATLHRVAPEACVTKAVDDVDGRAQVHHTSINFSEKPSQR